MRETNEQLFIWRYRWVPTREEIELHAMNGDGRSLEFDAYALLVEVEAQEVDRARLSERLRITSETLERVLNDSDGSSWKKEWELAEQNNQDRIAEVERLREELRDVRQGTSAACAELRDETARLKERVAELTGRLREHEIVADE